MKSSVLLIGIGVLSLLGGIVALLNPLAATLTAEMLTGYLFMAIGVLMLLSIFSDDSWGSRLLSLVLGIALLAIGVNLVSNPLQGVLQLTVVVAILMLIIGLLRLVVAFRMKSAGLKALLIVSGIISLALGTMILTSFPFSAAVVLGILLAIELISNGISMIALGLAARKPAS
ncbi:hypothetical protein RAZWK3B_08676 [Roseobacter sp. AzwK-3b]|uniref:HdeD family acid-resistance protein n=1 Tax=Roseobacter sp. AzwK-3b TaxID=351016 RepID=UPI0001569334|nr:DUF308 domain-containing protein [Roseobacter sp. AzwK-3b]EDM72311.1 hypothetical protein RAZWK3B_08676 [Roseobacter sp. AzwK-3b]